MGPLISQKGKKRLLGAASLCSALTFQLLPEQSLLLLHQCSQLGLQGAHTTHQLTATGLKAGQLQAYSLQKERQQVQLNI